MASSPSLGLASACALRVIWAVLVQHLLVAVDQMDRIVIKKPACLKDISLCYKLWSGTVRKMCH